MIAQIYEIQTPEEAARQARRVFVNRWIVITGVAASTAATAAGKKKGQQEHHGYYYYSIEKGWSVLECLSSFHFLPRVQKVFLFPSVPR